MQQQHQYSLRPKPTDHHRFSILDIKRNVERIKQKNAAHRLELQNYFMARRSIVDTHTFGDFATLGKANTPKQQKQPRLPRSLPREAVPGGFNGQYRMRTESLHQDRSKTLYYKKKRGDIMTMQTQTQTHLQNPQRSDSLNQISKVLQNRQPHNQPSPNRHQSLYESHIDCFQLLYQTLSSLMISLRKKPRILQQRIYEYVKIAQKTSFIDEFINECDPKYQKTLRTARFLEMVGVMYVGVETARGTLKDNYSNMGNFVGFAAASLVLIAKLYILSERSHKLSRSRFERVIAMFERATYYETLHDHYDIVFRIQHNNETVAKVQSVMARGHIKLQARLRQFSKQFHQQNIPSCLALMFIFQYLSYYLHANSLTNLLPLLDTAPCPYLPPVNPPKPTIIIQPFNVLLYSRLDKVFVRPYTSQLLQYLTQHSQVIFWSSLMPGEIENLLDRVDSAKRVQYRLFRYHCSRGRGGHCVKDVKRLGREVSQVFVVDAARKGFEEATMNGVEMFWTGGRKDRKLLELCEILAELFDKQMNVTEFCATMLTELRGIESLRQRRMLPMRRNMDYGLVRF